MTYIDDSGIEQDVIVVGKFPYSRASRITISRLNMLPSLTFVRVPSNHAERVFGWNIGCCCSIKKIR